MKKFLVLYGNTKCKDDLASLVAPRLGWAHYRRKNL
jgi:hypothetical protein